jgi:hypothetical protein
MQPHWEAALRRGVAEALAVEEAAVRAHVMRLPPGSTKCAFTGFYSRERKRAAGDAVLKSGFELAIWAVLLVGFTSWVHRPFSDVPWR